MDFLWAFIVGGAICVVGQLLIDLTKLTPARILVGFVVAGVILSAVGLYGPFSDFAGAGATVPLTGFGHTLVEGTKKAIDEQYRSAKEAEETALSQKKEYEAKLLGAKAEADEMIRTAEQNANIPLFHRYPSNFLLLFQHFEYMFQLSFP